MGQMRRNKNNYLKISFNFFDILTKKILKCKALKIKIVESQ